MVLKNKVLIKGGYFCQCSDGLTGHFCKSSGSLCDLNPCKHGKCTETSKTSYLCECDAGYAGKDCEIAVISSFNHSCNPSPCL